MFYNNKLLFSRLATKNRSFNNYVVDGIKSSGSKKSIFNTKTLKLTLTSGLLVKLYISRNVVLCEAGKTRLKGYEHSQKNIKFDWARLWNYLRPNIWYFLAAVVV